MNLRFKKGDAAVIAAVLLVAIFTFLCFLPKHSPAGYAEIYLDGKLLSTVDLNTPQEFTVTGTYAATITVADGCIAVTASTCPGGDCVDCGWASNAGRSIVCLPGGLEIRIVGSSGDVDITVG